MLILPPGHAHSLGQPRVFRRRERAMLGGVLAALVALLLVLFISLGSADRQSGHGCISVGLAYSTGGAQIYRCGTAARSMCADVGRPGGPVGATARSLRTECRKAGIPVG
ncbi:MAG TPA: hypothetical protein VF781_02580 [Solirubrobacteraceae bacterium]